jgi:hypothetical protein
MIHKIVAHIMYLSVNLEMQWKSRMRNNPGYPGFPDEKIL